ncbi:MAG TPA: hypothetical protein VK463_00500 [Desulfomonilaceae bacterium]|nr:hypothetical protein [Desulfomonilaceae bacterium]
MLKHRVWFLGIILSLSLMVAGPASAWEFTMDGNFNWLYEVRGQGGTAGFFGPYDIDNGSGIVASAGIYAPINGWLGAQLNDLVSGTSGARNTMWMVNNMDLRINPAMRVRGQYYIGEWATLGFYSNAPFANNDIGSGNLVAAEYNNARFPGIQRSFSPGYWNTLWLTAQLPWGTLTLGKRPSSFGMGLYYNGEESRSSEKFALTADYGPIRIQFGFEANRRNRTDSDFNPTVAPTAGTGAAGQIQTAGYFNQDYDQNNSRVWDMTAPSVTYRSGNIDMGALWNPVYLHNGGEGFIGTPGRRNTRTYRDREQNYGDAYFKYNNGRFFFNSEVGWFHEINRVRVKNINGTPDFTRTRDFYTENWRYGAEAGILCGPSKFSFLYTWSAGPDRRGRGTGGGGAAGVPVQQIDRNGVIVFPGPSGFAAGTANAKPGDTRQSTSFSDTGVYRPYSYLAVYSYGLGTHINGDTGNGYVEDAYTLAGRLDYSVASNLNVYGSFFWAERASKSGWGWGFIKPVRFAPTMANNGQITNELNAPVVAPGAVGIFYDTVHLFAPNIPDTNLGYEVDAGFDWKLLEGFLVNATFAYWQPGNWYKWACVDKSVPNWAIGQNAANGGTPANWGINPNRAIDPIWGMELKIAGEF